jgi:orotate phosphoribosyltransferase
MGPLSANCTKIEFNEASDRERLLELIKTNALERREVVLSTGKVSDYYVDCKRVTLSPEGAYLTARLMIELVRPDVSVVAGLTLGADPIVSTIAILSHIQGRDIPALIVRKEPKKHGTKRFIEGPTIPRGSRVVVVDDVVTSGASIIRCLERLSIEGYMPVQVIALLDRLEGGRESLEAAGYKLETLFTRNDLLG